MENPLSKLTRRERYGLAGFTGILAAIVLGNWGYNRLSPPPLTPTTGGIPLVPEQPTPAPSPTSTPLTELVVYVTGAVNKPGVYRFKPGQRLYEAVEKAGGFRPDAVREALNMADQLKDADQIHIPVKVAVREPEPRSPSQAPVRRTTRVVTLVPPAPVQVIARRSTGRVLGLGGSGATKSIAPAPRAESVTSGAGEAPAAEARPGKPGKLKSPEDGTVNINTADAEELQRLPGVGPAIAGRIIGYRDEVGRFQTLEDLKEVKGIGEKTFAKLRPLITI
jgi:competence protein ComEA